MFVCVCKAVSDRTIDQAIATHGPCPDAVGFETGAGTCCGTCRPWIEQRCAQSKGEPALPTVPLSAAQETAYGRSPVPTPSVHEPSVQPVVIVPRRAHCA